MIIGKSSLDVGNYFDWEDEMEFEIDEKPTWLSRHEVVELVNYLNGILESDKGHYFPGEKGVTGINEANIEI